MNSTIDKLLAFFPGWMREPLTARSLLGPPKAPRQTFGFERMGDFMVIVARAGVDKSLRVNDERLVRYFAAAPDAASENVGADGGFVVPTKFAEAWWDAIFSASRIMQIFRPFRAETPTIQFPQLDNADLTGFAGVTPVWMAELQQHTQQKPRWTLVSMILHKLGTFLPISNELVEDAPPEATELLENGAKWGHQRAHEDAIISGSGVGRPQGILSSPSTITQSRAQAGRITWTDIRNMWARNVFRSTSVWLTNWTTMPLILDLAQMLLTDDGSTAVNALPRANIGDDGSVSVLGRPVLFNDSNPALGSAGDIVLASPLGYTVALRGEITVAHSKDFFFHHDALAVRVTSRIGGQSLFAKPFTPGVGDTQSWAVSLAA